MTRLILVSQGENDIDSSAPHSSYSLEYTFCSGLYADPNNVDLESCVLPQGVALIGRIAVDRD
jgi:hypothetical protein